MACIGVTSLIGRLIFGFVSDLPLVRRNGNRIVLQQVTMTIVMMVTMTVTVTIVMVTLMKVTMVMIVMPKMVKMMAAG